ncbi:HEPN domain-containing protein [bacterium]|nr:HEPN domain-containing protein [bacterium]
MSIDKLELYKKVRQWQEYADENLLLAQHALTLSSSCPYRLIAYHAQQCAEKYLKAYLVYHLTDFPHTHDIQNLLELCSENAEWPISLDTAKILTAYAVTTRYPGIAEITKDEAINAIDIASQVKQTVQHALAEDGFQSPQNT